MIDPQGAAILIASGSVMVGVMTFIARITVKRNNGNEAQAVSEWRAAVLVKLDRLSDSISEQRMDFLKLMGDSKQHLDRQDVKMDTILSRLEER